MRRALAISCFFFSGFAALVYEICWIRKAALVFGSTTYALSTVLAVFFCGMAIGSWLFGRLGKRHDRPIHLYALLEISLGILAILSLWGFSLAEDVFGSLYRALTADGGLVTPGSPLLVLLRVGLIAIVLLPPTILMGGTLPLFCRQFVIARSSIAGMIGLLYGVNTLGAAAGAAVTGFFLLPTIGVKMSVALAAAINQIVALVALSLKLEVEESSPDDPTSAAPPQDIKPDLRHFVVGTLFFMTGLVALGAEIVWARFLALIVRNSIYTYTITLTVVLVGIVLGSLIASRLFDRRWPLAVVFGLFQILAALLMLVLMWLPVFFWRDLGQGWAPFVVLLLAPAVLSGASFPLAMRLVLSDPGRSTQVVGSFAAINIIGGIVGSLLTGFLLVPVWGLAVSVKLIALGGVISGSLALVLVDRRAMLMRRGAIARTLVIPVALAAWFLLPRISAVRIPADYLAPRGALVDFAEGQGSTLAAVKKDGALHLHIDRLWQGKNLKTHQIMAAHLPMLLAPQSRDVLLIGVGVGQTAARFLQHGIDRLDCVDIEPRIFSFIDRHFDTEWMQDPRANLIIDDGRAFSTHTGRRYDLISIEAGQVHRPGVETFYTREFYLEAKALLRPGGVIAQFVPIAFLEEPEFRAILRTLMSVFPEAALWYNTNELLLIGGRDSLPVFSRSSGEILHRNAVVRADLRWSHWGGAEEHLLRTANILGCFLCAGGELRDLAAGGVILSDDKPVLSYATRTAVAGNRRDATLSALIGAHLTPIPWTLSADLQLTGDDLEIAATMRRGNLNDLVAASHLRVALSRLEGQGPRGARSSIERALAANPQSFLANRMMGEVLNLTRKQSEAIPWLRKAVAMRPADRLAPRDLALSLLQTGGEVEAERILLDHLHLWPEDAVAHNYLGAIMAGTGHMQEARRYFRRAVELDPHDRSARENLERSLREN